MLNVNAFKLIKKTNQYFQGERAVYNLLFLNDVIVFQTISISNLFSI